MPRYLLYHPESECLFEVQTHAAAQHCCSEGCENVTNIAEYERRFNLEKEKIVVQRRTVATSKKQEVVPVQHSDPYHIRYRPTKLSEVIGHKEVVKALDSMLNSKSRSHTFLFTGQKGIGKTTFARILAHEFQCDLANPKTDLCDLIDFLNSRKEELLMSVAAENRLTTLMAKEMLAEIDAEIMKVFTNK